MRVLQGWKYLLKKGNHGEEEEGCHEAVVDDGSVGVTGRPCLRATTGGWLASIFIIGVEFGERMAYYGIASSLILYLTTKMGIGVERAAKDVNNWSGVTTCIPFLGGFLADAYFGRYWMVFISTIIYILGLIVLALSVSLKSLKPSSEAQKAVFFLGLYLIAVGTGGHKPCLQSFGADQFNEGDPEEKKKKASFFNWWYSGLCAGVLVGVTVIVGIQDNVSWGTSYAILTTGMILALLIFIAGTPFYRNMVPRGSPLTRIAQVFTATFLNESRNLSPQSIILYEDGHSASQYPSQRLLFHTESLKFLDRAAMVEKGMGSNIQEEKKPWKLCSVTQVEETKLVVRVLPIWLCCLMYGVGIAQTTTFFVKQGSTMNRNLGSSHFQIPSASLLAPTALTMTVLAPIYDRFFVPLARKLTGNERGISLLQRIGVGMLLLVLTMAVAAVVESKILAYAESHGLLSMPKTEIVPMSVLWLLPQFFLLGVADLYALVGMQEFFYDQVPDNMRSLGIALYLGVLGFGSFLSSLLITIVDKITTTTSVHPKSSWFNSNVNRSHLDYFYWLLAILIFLNFLVFLFFARQHTYKHTKPRSAVQFSQEHLHAGAV